jgi:hypothetical protein
MLLLDRAFASDRLALQKSAGIEDHATVAWQRPPRPDRSARQPLVFDYHGCRLERGDVHRRPLARIDYELCSAADARGHPAVLSAERLASAMKSSSAHLPFPRSLQLFATTISGLSLAALLCTTNALALALVLSLRARWTRSAAMMPASPAFSRVTAAPSTSTTRLPSNT